MLFAATGCSVGPNFTPPQATVADKWRGAGNARVTAQTAADGLWWKSFNDPALDRLIELAYRQNLPLQISGLRIVEARAQFAVATGRQFPQTQALFGTAEAVGLTEQVARYTGLDRNLLSYQIGFDAAWELDFWGKYRRGVESEAAGLLASVADYDAALVSLTAEVARTYVALRTFEVLIRRRRRTRASRRRRSGSPRRASRRARPRSWIRPRRRRCWRARAPPFPSSEPASSRRATRSPGCSDSRRAPSTRCWRDRRRSRSRPAKVAVGVPAEMLRRRPDIRGAELSAAAQCARIGVAKAELYPSFSLLGTIGLRAFSSGSGVAQSLLHRAASSTRSARASTCRSSTTAA